MTIIFDHSARPDAHVKYQPGAPGGPPKQPNITASDGNKDFTLDEYTHNDNLDIFTVHANDSAIRNVFMHVEYNCGNTDLVTWRMFN